MFQILVAEGDRALRARLCGVLAGQGYRVIPAADGLEAFDRLEDTIVDLIVTGVRMPHMNGFEMTRALRDAHYELPVLLLAVSGDRADLYSGFRAGIDDCIRGAVDPEELLWRVEALLRRTRQVCRRKTRIGATELDWDTLTVRTAGGEMALPQKEFGLLFKLAASPGRIFTRRQIIDELWGFGRTADHTLDVHISRLRERFRDNPDFELVTVRGLGYKVICREHGRAVGASQ